MELSAHWKNQFIQPEKKASAERAMEEFLLAHFGSASNAFNSKVSFNNSHQPPNHPWHIAIVKGEALAIRGLPPCGIQNKGWEIKFYDD